MSQENKKCANKLDEKVDPKIDDRSHEFLHQLYYFIENYEGQLPNLRDIFRTEAIEWLLTESIKNREDPAPLVDFVINTGYKDEPKVDGDGKTSSRRTTPIHYAAEQSHSPSIISDLFKIYDRCDVNYTDEDGYTHFHIACENDCDDVVEKFLDRGQVDPNLLVPQTGDSPLHLALLNNSERVLKLLLRSGADNLANAEGLTPLHIISTMDFSEDVVEVLFEISNENNLSLQVNAWDNEGNAPLHVAMVCGHKKVTESLLRLGADPNLVNEEGLTPLHILIHDNPFDDDLLKMFFKINGELNQPVQVDAKDKLGRTPLQLAVAKLAPKLVNFLLDYGADLSCFVFPTQSYFVEMNSYYTFGYKLRQVPSLLIIVEHLVKRGYQMDRNDALTIMLFFTKNSLFENSMDLEKYWINEEFTDKTKEMMITSSLSLYDLIRLRPKEAAKLLTLEDYYKFERSNKLWDLSENHHEACSVNLCEKASRGFFRRWSLDPFMELTHYQLPILCCEIIIDKLMNEDLCNICLAAAGQTRVIFTIVKFFK